MRPIGLRHNVGLSDVMSLAHYERCRAEYRQRIIALKQKRRVALGPLISLLFESRETVLFQIQETIRLEMPTSPTATKKIISAYAGLVPQPGQLTATMFIEIRDLSGARDTLTRLAGISHCLSLQLSSKDKVMAESQEREESRAEAVTFVKFRLSPDQIKLFENAAALHLAVTHPGYKARTIIPKKVREALLEELLP